MTAYVDARGLRFTIERDLSDGTYIATRPGFHRLHARRFPNAGAAMRWLRRLVPGGLRLSEPDVVGGGIGDGRRRGRVVTT